MLFYDVMAIQRFPHLAHWGAYTAVVEDGRLIRCEPFQQDQAPSRMIDSIVPYVYAKERIQRPAIRQSWLDKHEHSDRSLRGKESFVTVPWDEALDLIAHEYQRVRSQYGTNSIFAGSYGWASAGRFHHGRSQLRNFYALNGGSVDQTGNYSWGSAQFFLPYVIGTYDILLGKMTEWRSIESHCELFIAIGGLAIKNAQIGAGGVGEHKLAIYLKKLADKHIPIINISPMRDDCPDFIQAEWIPIRPNTDAALLLALCNEILKSGQEDQAFLQQYCVGIDAFKAYLFGDKDGIHKDADWASHITGIPAQRIKQLAKQLIGVRSYITCSYAVQRAHRGEQPYWLVIALASILGQIGLPGGGFGFGHGSGNGISSERIALPAPTLPMTPNPGPKIPVARIADMLLHPGETYAFQGKKHIYPDIHLIHWAGGNPFHHHQQLNRLVEGWRQPDTVIVQDIVWTAAAKMADIVLPITTTLERNDIGASSRDPYVFAMHQAIKPQYQARNDYDVFAELAERVGLGTAFTHNRDEQAWLRNMYDTWHHTYQTYIPDLADFETFWDKGYVTIPKDEKPFVLFEDFRQNPTLHALKTPSGKIELFSQTIADYHLADLAPYPEWRPPVEWLGAEKAQQYPLHLISIQPKDRLHSQLANTPLVKANQTAGKETLYMHPDDAKSRQLHQGDLVNVFNDRGSIYAGVVLTEGLTAGVVIMSTGAWFDPGFGKMIWHQTEQSGNPNVLTLDIGTSSLTQGPNAMSCLVDVIAASTQLSQPDQQTIDNNNH